MIIYYIWKNKINGSKLWIAGNDFKSKEAFKNSVCGSHNEIAMQVPETCAKRFGVVQFDKAYALPPNIKLPNK